MAINRRKVICINSSESEGIMPESEEKPFPSIGRLTDFEEFSLSENGEPSPARGGMGGGRRRRGVVGVRNRNWFMARRRETLRGKILRRTALNEMTSLGAGVAVPRRADDDSSFEKRPLMAERRCYIHGSVYLLSVASCGKMAALRRGLRTLSSWLPRGHAVISAE